MYRLCDWRQSTYIGTCFRMLLRYETTCFVHRYYLSIDGALIYSTRQKKSTKVGYGRVAVGYEKVDKVG
jgi:hypothetical protein